MAGPGSYLLVIDCEQPTEIEVGALGSRAFEAGYYAYVGSAFGPGGLSRVDRHRQVDAGDHDVRHWHVDYLLGAAETELATVETFPDRDLECELSTALGAAGCERVAAFGASDCDCPSHLWGPTDRSRLRDVADSFRA
ncbi:GIY-YIG nuclease family protein [Halohasta salina]|uniref:GIY-YIG nuclease family protein n=1 Tax=Halohasta salina TaxID=2961621 RepID=UPI0020A3F7A7|nr:GIY-YIG nuclease family protein [Halohasta salina]